MTIERINPGTRSSEMVVHNDTIYVTTTPNKPYDPALSAADQARQILATVDKRLASLGTDKSKLLATQIWLSDIRYFDEVNVVWDAWIDPANPPSRACACVVAMGKPDLKVEMIMVAAK